MKLFGSSLIAQGIRAAGVGAVLMLSLSASYAQSGPFAGFNGVWSGNGTVALSDGTTERIRCKADYKVDGTGLGLKQNLRCASDSYKFELTTDLHAGDGNFWGFWKETSRNVNGEIHGTGGNGQFNGRVEANGYVAELNLTVSGSKQTINITSKSTELRGLNISLSKS